MNCILNPRGTLVEVIKYVTGLYAIISLGTAFVLYEYNQQLADTVSSFLLDAVWNSRPLAFLVSVTPFLIMAVERKSGHSHVMPPQTPTSYRPGEKA